MARKYPFTKIMNWLCTTKIIGSKRKNVLFLLLRLSIGFSGCMKTHKLTIKQMNGLIGLYPRAISKALYQLRDIGWIDFNKGKKLKKGGKFVVEIQECLFNYTKDTYLKNKIDEDDKVQESSNKVPESEVKVPESSNKVQKEHNPPLTKEIYKDTFKDTLKDEISIELFIEKWKINKIVNIDALYYAFNNLNTEEQKKLITSLHEANKHYADKEEDYRPQAQNYIKNRTFLKFYDKAHHKEIQDKRAENEWLKSVARRTPEQIEKIRRENEE